MLATGGIGLLCRSGDGALLSVKGMLLVFASSLSYALYIVGVNRPALKDTPTLAITFYVLLFGLALFVFRTGCCTQLVHPSSDFPPLFSNPIFLLILLVAFVVPGHLLMAWLRRRSPPSGTCASYRSGGG